MVGSKARSASTTHCWNRSKAARSPGVACLTISFMESECLSAGSIGGILRAMRAFISIAFLTLVYLAANPPAAANAAESASPVGVWKTFDDKQGKARAICRLYEPNGNLFGPAKHSFTPATL